MDYGALTTCETEYNKAVCLCGSHLCRESFMTFTGMNSFHEILRGFGPLMVFRTLIQVIFLNRRSRKGSMLCICVQYAVLVLRVPRIHAYMPPLVDR